MICFERQYGWQIAEAAGCVFNPNVDVVIARVEGGRLLGGVIFTGYTGASIQLHTAGFDPRWVCRDLLWVVFHYAFVQCNCKVSFCQIPETNSKSLEFVKKLGFKEVTRVDDVFLDGGLVVVGMRREDCRWLSLKPRTLKEPSVDG